MDPYRAALLRLLGKPSHFYIWILIVFSRVSIIDKGQGPQDPGQNGNLVYQNLERTKQPRLVNPGKPGLNVSAGFWMAVVSFRLQSKRSLGSDWR